MQLLLLLGRADVFPVGDLGIRRGMATLFDADRTRAAMDERAGRWRPYRRYASRSLWRVGEDITGSVAEVVEE